MARRRRRRYTWFPTLGTGSGFVAGDLSGRQVQIGVQNNGSPNIIVVPLTFDFPSETTDAGVTGATPLVDFIGNEYIIERIVGNMFYNLSSANITNTGVAVLVTAGLFVSRADDLDPDQPIGSAALADELRNYSPAFADNIREPWMFRRTWILGHAHSVQATTGAALTVSNVGQFGQSTNLNAYPMSNIWYGTAVGGPFVDVKTARRITTDERLFWVTTAQNIPIDSVQEGIVNLLGYFDYRILGAIVKPHNKSSF